MSMKQIISGHVKEFFNQEQELSEIRMNICKVCPLYKVGQFGPICNSELYLNPITNETNYVGGEGMKRGCACRLNAKTRIEDAHCPNEKW